MDAAGNIGPGYEACVRLLVEAGANRTIKNIRGETAFDLAKDTAIKTIIRGSSSDQPTSPQGALTLAGPGFCSFRKSNSRVVR